jgi:hypothetical protein
MKMHFGQLQEKRQCGKATDKASNQIHIPSWVPPPWVIPLIDKDDKSKKKPAKDDRPRVEIQIDERGPEQESPGEEPDDPDRGVAILEI